MENTLFSDSSTSAAQKRVKSALDFSLKAKYGIDNEEVTRKILKVHGLDVSNFDSISNTEKNLSGDLKEHSLDQNSNKSGLTVSGLINESVTIPYSKLIGQRYLYRKMKEMFGKSEAKKLSGEMYDYSIALNDSSKILQPYCYSYDFSKMVLEGRPFGQLHSLPPKHLSSYINALDETIHQLSNQQAGAIACGSFFEDSIFILYYREKINLNKIKKNKKAKKYIENCYQTFVHSINHLSRNATESPFTNISILDRPKLETLISAENFGWYFNEIPKWFFGNKEKWFKYVVDGIVELQNIFMNFFDKGDPSKNGLPYRFPVCTIQFSKKEDGSINDFDFLENVSKREIFRYNIMVSKSTRSANCCRLLSDSAMFDMGGEVSSLGLSQISLGSHRVAIINFNRIALEANSEETYFKILIERAFSAAKILKAHKELLSELEKKGYQPFITNGYIRFDRMFSTYGVLGLVEGARNLVKKFGNTEDYYIEKTLVLLNNLAKGNGTEFGININIEQVPAESMASRLREVDQLIFKNVEVSEAPLYSNQFIELWKDCSVWERMDIDGKFNKLYTGGGIVSFNLGERPTSSQVKKLIEYSIHSGCEHFSLNAVYSSCENNHTSFGNFELCPVCNGKVTDKYTRVVGFFVRVSDFNTVRKNWEFPRRLFKSVA